MSEAYEITDLEYFKNKREKKREKRVNRNKNQSNLILKTIEPKTETQAQVFNSYNCDRNLFLHGIAGTGKSYLSLYFGLDSLLFSSDVEKVIIVRSAAPSRDIGFLPGNSQEKMRDYETPYIEIVNDLFGRDDAYHILKNKKQLEFVSTSFLRGITLNNAIVIVDECQNMSFEELNTIITRIGRKSKIFFCGDYRQNDIGKESGLNYFSRIIKEMNSFDFHEFGIEDIVRSGLVKEYIIAKDKVDRR